MLAGPNCARYLADYGADVIKVEPPGAGDPMRIWGQGKDKVQWEVIARNKKSVSANLRIPEGQELVRKLIATADVLIENFKPGTMEKWGLSPERLLAEQPGLIIARMSGYGQTGPLALQAGHDINYLALSGMLAQTTDDDGRPVLPNLQVADLLGGAQTAVQGILAALLGVKMGSPGRLVDVSMTDAVVVHNIMPLLALNHAGHTAPPARDFLTGGVPCYAIYRCSDGKYLAVGALELKFWQTLCDVIARPDLKGQHWSLGQAIGSDEAMQLRRELDTVFATRSRDAWAALFAPADCCVTPVLTLDEAIHTPHFIDRQLLTPIEHPSEGPCLQARAAVRFMA